MKRAHTDARRRAFALAYAKDQNGQSALKAAGYAPRSCMITSLLQHPVVRAVLDDQALRAAAATGVDVASVVHDLDELRQVDIGDVFEDDGDGQPRMREWKSLSRSARRAIHKVKITRRSRRTGEMDDRGNPIYEDEVTTEVSLVDRLEVLQKLGNHLGAFKATEPPPTPGNTYIVVVPEPMKTVEAWLQQLPPGR